ncbi:zinc finger protein 432-like [Dreissena polymorpha]|uniref:C2H2-type domain-containing protein n=1 Tax=Dreissena polymorpha TaxID=45954 RepID=A0A9D4C5B5_DREPO|nr:zinc finger protein 432-like [Dreissena polymorpha]XP_052248585.1 zinc finger protein 432-like [Dreissena polymorpha]XP_052248586.1 zinc finger protein 432-like [Dreissena polymorpha]XP_052248587.1 zinc finger protein 432-like [Dreissena polymorpha]XP_052248588.1 zinc finger protein 432-like [Dreissena polymorpha]XP_052248589.1 zinc finger protein 432-like [Dreissena polymorpha]XP_052248590.1 zinc finger protein 432-like [Dreissena polymorpha]XP_052248592.1 zinc finger protein 432-like [D
METADINQLTCRRCWISFENIDQFLMHQSYQCSMALTNCHSPKGRYTCQSCVSQFESTCALHNHMQSCSNDGSYFFYNSDKVAIPLSVHNVDSYLSDGEGAESVGNLQNLIQAIVNSKSEIVVALWNGLKSLLMLHQDIKLSAQDQPKNTLNPDIDEKEDASKIHIANICEKETCTIQTIKKRKSRKSQVSKKGRIYTKTQFNRNVPLQKADTNSPKNEITSNSVQGFELSKSKIDINIEDNKNHHKENNELSNNKSLSVKNKVVRDLKGFILKRKYNSLKNKDSISSDKKRNTQRSQICSVCDKSMPMCQMKIHMAKHSDERPFECDICRKKYKYQKHLTAHHQTHSTHSFFCDRCGSGFATISLLRSHIISKHTEACDKPAKCDICGAGFANQYRLNRHRMQHTGSKPLQCDLCGMGFRQLYNLQQHVSTKHRKERRFACKQCEKKFVTNYQLKCHILQHSGVRPYACKICTKAYTQKKELRRHMKTFHSMTMDEESLPDLTKVFEELQGTDPMLEHTADNDTRVEHQFSGGHLPSVETLDSTATV